jgi:hypothetical protein
MMEKAKESALKKPVTAGALTKPARNPKTVDTPPPSDKLRKDGQ